MAKIKSIEQCADICKSKYTYSATALKECLGSCAGTYGSGSSSIISPVGVFGGRKKCPPGYERTIFSGGKCVRKKTYRGYNGACPTCITSKPANTGMERLTKYNPSLGYYYLTGSEKTRLSYLQNLGGPLSPAQESELNTLLAKQVKQKSTKDSILGVVYNVFDVFGSRSDNNDQTPLPKEEKSIPAWVFVTGGVLLIGGIVLLISVKKTV